MMDNRPATKNRLIPYSILACLIISWGALCLAEAPPVQLAGIYTDDIDVRDYWVSEKLDGVRAYWNGEHLISRQGNIFTAPDWFTAPLPATHLDGELWIARGRFEEVSGIARTTAPSDQDWRNVHYMVFDLPQSEHTFSERLKQLQQLVPAVNAPWISLVQQFRVADETSLMHKLDEVVRNGGEGLMLHKADARHRSGRSDHLLKLKRYQDAEARVIAHLTGKGKYEGMLGSLLVEDDQNRRFRIGTGFTDLQRRNPPPVGATITYRFSGFTKSGLPRFASFMRIREEF